MVPVVVLLQFVEPTSAVLGGVDVMQGVVRQIIGQVADKEGRPEESEVDRILNGNYFAGQREE